MDPKGKVAIVTGGNSGLGAAIAARLLADGARVVSLDVAGEPPAGVEAIACDVSNPVDVKAAVCTVIARHGAVHILINNAGIATSGPVASPDGPGDVADFRRALEINLIGAFAVAAEVAHRMIGNDPVGPDAERGIIINTCSIASFEGQESASAYTGSKAALAALVQVWARDLSAHNIRVNGIAPGLMATPLVAALPGEVIDVLLQANEYPRRTGTGEEFASAVDFLLRNTLVNAEILRLDGGCRLPARNNFGSGQ